MVLSPGDTLGAYTIRSQIGAGGMGEVYRAHDARLDRFVAIKILRQGISDETARDRFFREARTIARLAHPNVIAVYDVGEHAGLPFLVMEMVDGPSLAAIIDERQPLTLDTTVRYVADLCDALSHAHGRGVVHRDVKPSNVLIDAGRARLADFGIALDPQATQTAVAGSPNYFAPEQMTGTADHRADLFALGALLYELLTGTKAFPGSISDGVLYRIAHAPAPELPPGLAGSGIAALVARALEKDPTSRFQSAEEFKLALAHASTASVAGVAQQPAAAPVPQLDSEVVRFRRRLIEAVAPPEVRRLKYEVAQYLATRPYDVDARVLSDDIERALGVPEPAQVTRAAPSTRPSWGRVAAYTSMLAVAVIGGSTYMMMRGTPSSPAGGESQRSASTALPNPDAERRPETLRSGGSVQDEQVPAAGRSTATDDRSAAAKVPTAATPSPSPADRRVPTLDLPLPRDTSALLVETGSSRESIGRLMAEYEAAYARRDAAAVKAVFPDADAQLLSAAREQYRVWRYSMSIRSIKVSGNEATVEADVNLETETNAGVKASERTHTTFRLRRTDSSLVAARPERWSIGSIELVTPR